MLRINVINAMRTISVFNLLKTLDYLMQIILTNSSAFSVALYPNLTVELTGESANSI